MTRNKTILFFLLLAGAVLLLTYGWEKTMETPAFEGVTGTSLTVQTEQKEPNLYVTLTPTTPRHATRASGYQGKTFPAYSAPQRSANTGGITAFSSNERTGSYGSGLAVPMAQPLTSATPVNATTAQPTVLVPMVTAHPTYAPSTPSLAPTVRRLGGMGTIESTWQSWLDEYNATGQPLTTEGLAAWWNATYGGDDGYPPDLFDEFSQWAIPMGDGVGIGLLFAFGYALFRLLKRKNTMKKLKKYSLTLLLLLALSPLQAQTYPCFTPTGIAPVSYAALSTLLPSTLQNTIYQNGEPQFDKLFIPLALPAAFSTVLGLEANVPYLFEFRLNTGLKYDSQAGTEKNYIAWSQSKLTEKTIFSAGYLNQTAGQRFYFAGTTSQMAYFGVPYIAPTGILPATADALLSVQFPTDYLTTLWSGTTARMDALFVAMNFNVAQASALSSALGITLPASTTLVFPFSKVVLADGAQFYVPTDATLPTAKNFTLTHMGGKKIWCYGTIPEASAGGKNSEGYFYFQGTDHETVDIYLDHFQIQKVSDKTFEITFNDIMSGGLTGMASAFAFGSNGDTKGDQAFTACFHIEGDNQLAGGARTLYEMNQAGTIEKMLLSLLRMSGAPISARPIAGDEGIASLETKTMNFAFDDLFPKGVGTKHTNGRLSLPVALDEIGTREAPSIDLGNANGSCVFNGGQYTLTTAVSNSMFYVSSMAIGYRMLDLLGIRVFGMGTSLSTPASDNTQPYTVKINDGTFSTYSARDCQKVVDVVAQGWYAAYNDLRMPLKTLVDGGSFNCELRTLEASAEMGTNPYNSKGDYLCRMEQWVNDSQIDPSTGLVALTSRDLGEHTDYGHLSLTPQAVGNAHYYFPYWYEEDCGQKPVAHIQNWVSVIPLMGVKSDGLELTMGGDQTVLTEEPYDHMPRINSCYFYTRLNEYTKKNASVSIMNIPVKVQQAINLAGNDEFTEITNEADYTFENGLYTMLSFESNHWYTLTPPYDVHHIYTLETLPDDSLSANNLTLADKGTDKYLKKQGEKDGLLAQGIVTSLLPDILSKKGSGVSMDLMDICRQTLHLEPLELIHYNPHLPGHSIREASYYLYEQIEEADDLWSNPGLWNLMDNVNAYSQKWQYASLAESSMTYTKKDGSTVTNPPIVLQKGHVYSFFLPAGKDKYWDGKYLIFEGYGPQTMTGKSTFQESAYTPEMLDEYYEDQASQVLFLQGNSTSALDTIPSYYFTPAPTAGSRYDFQRQEPNTVVKPWEVYLMMNTSNASQFETLSALLASQPLQMPAVAERQDPNLLTPSARTLLACAQNGLTVMALQGQAVQVYTLSGASVWSGYCGAGSIQTLALPSGLYLVRGEKEMYKIILNE